MPVAALEEPVRLLHLQSLGTAAIRLGREVRTQLWRGKGALLLFELAVTAGKPPDQPVHLASALASTRHAAEQLCETLQPGCTRLGIGLLSMGTASPGEAY
eukprot:CAMPEP_0170615414 /NCGR_PEP_ID=MMETSP0224-20130122/25322_1 /TAXON_ID=285029 /ORGANISM="Togula jolla, Strain CCCM 725" /LENGTH=100 /DNA_ID=CAMNT_0010941139 /DNA_START=419 /DNA_END=721 /DNA_ORIENTATION=-